MTSPCESSSHEIRVSVWTGPLCSAPSTIQAFPRTVTKLPTCGIEGVEISIVPSFITAPPLFAPGAPCTEALTLSTVRGARRLWGACWPGRFRADEERVGGHSQELA